jgi:hypothetical protein
MKRHLLIGCLGTLDRPSVTPLANEQATFVDLVSGQKRLGHGIGDAIRDLTALDLFPSEHAVDLLLVAALVYAADTRISRATESQDNWTREIRVQVPVLDVGKWSACSDELQRLLNFLTGDRWTILFRGRPSGFALLVPARPAERKQANFDAVSLFSGGLDSLIGAIDLLAAKAAPLLISHASEGATSAAQDVCFNALVKAYKDSGAARLRMWLNFPKTMIAGVGSDDTTRGRSFLFFALATFAATGLDRPVTIRVPENGLISLNVPLDPTRLGSLSTRTTHPFYMARWNSLLSALGIPCQLENPYWNKTKGEMVDECANRGLLVKLLPSSMSCASPAKARWQGHPNQHCGFCLPCIIRRAAIEYALGKGKDPTTYTMSNLRSHAFDTLKAEGKQIRSFQVAISRLDANPALAKALIHKPGPLSDDHSRLGELADVYLRGMQEVSKLLGGVKTKPAD